MLGAKNKFCMHISSTLIFKRRANFKKKEYLSIRVLTNLTIACSLLSEQFSWETWSVWLKQGKKGSEVSNTV